MDTRNEEGVVNYTVQTLLRQTHNKECPKHSHCSLAKTTAYSIGTLDRAKRLLEEREYDAAYSAVCMTLRAFVRAITNDQSQDTRKGGG